MTILCVGMCYAGYVWRPQPLRVMRWDFDERRLLWAAAVLSLGGAFFFLSISRMPAHLKSGPWTGLPVAYKFFADMLTYGLVIAVLVFARTRSNAALAVASFGYIFYFDRVLIAARRETIAELVLLLVCAFWFTQRWIPPRRLVIIGLIGAVFFVYSTGEYRAIMRADRADPLTLSLPRLWKQAADIDYWANFDRVLQDGGPEFRLAVFGIAASDTTSRFDFGLSYWNSLVFRYVPAQLLGADFKRSLMFERPEDAWRTYGYRMPHGSTSTGVRDSFEAFWYFGCLVFFAIAYVLRKLFEAAQRGHFVAQLVYMLTLTDALLAITHHTKWFFLPWLHMAVFILPALRWARRSRCKLSAGKNPQAPAAACEP